MSKITLLKENTTYISSEGTSTNIAKYLTVNGVEWKLPYTDLSKYMPLSGGVMAGAIKNNFDSNEQLIGVDSTKNIDIWSGTKQDEGAGLILHGGGGVELQAKSNSGVAWKLVCNTMSSKKLTWNNDTVLDTLNTKVSADGTSTEEIQYITINNTQYAIEQPSKHVYEHIIDLTSLCNRYATEYTTELVNHITFRILFKIVNDVKDSYTKTITSSTATEINTLLDSIISCGYTSNSTYLPVVGGYYGYGSSGTDYYPTMNCPVYGIHCRVRDGYYRLTTFMTKDSSDPSKMIESKEFDWTSTFAVFCTADHNITVHDTVTQIC